MASQGPHSGLIIEVPEAEPAVRHHREHLDANAPFGIPAHITVLFPFMPPETIDPPALTRLRQLFAGASRFRFRLDHTDWFGDDVLWLAPQNPRPFRALTKRVFRAYPAFPPFDGQFGEVVPHLTIGHPEPLQIGDILNDPSLLTGLTPEAALIRLGWTGGVPSGWTVTRLGRGGHVGLGFVLRQQFETPRGRIGNTGTMLRWYPGNGRYALPNWKVSLPESGRDIGPDGQGYPTPQSAYWNQPGTPEEIFDLMNGGGGSASNSGEGPTPNSGNDDSGSGTDDTGPCACGGTDPEPFGSDDAARFRFVLVPRPSNVNERRNLVPEKSAGISLDADSVEMLNSVLQDCDLVSCVVDRDSRLAIVTANVFRILPEDGLVDEEYPLCLAVYPVGRVAASHVVEGEVQPLALESINQVLRGFSYHGIEDWDIIDPPVSLQFKWRDKVSLDARWGDNQEHVMELWQDGAPIQLFNMALWFDRLYVFDMNLRPVSLDMLVEWEERLKVAMHESVGPGGGWSRSIPAPSPPVQLSRVLDLIREGPGQSGTA